MIAKIYLNSSNVNELTNYRAEIVHNLNTQELIPVLYDNTGRVAILADKFSIGYDDGSQKNNVVFVNFGQPIEGEWILMMYYQGPAERVSGRRAFELQETTPMDDERLIFGKAFSPACNITFANFFTLLLDKLGFLKKSENLNDILDKAQALTNLGAYSKTYVDNALGDKATLLQASSGAVLGVANTTIYEPTSPYHPATLKSITDRIAAIQAYATYMDAGLAHGSEVIGDIDESSNKEGTISLGVTLSNTNYRILCEVYEPNGQPVYVTIKAKTTTNFTYHVTAAYNSAVQSVTLNWKAESL